MKGLLAIYDPSPDQLRLADKFVNRLMECGKKAVAQRVFNQALKQVKRRLPRADPLEVFVQAIDSLSPSGNTVPDKVAIRFIISAAKSSAGKPMYVRLADVIVNNYKFAMAARLAGPRL
jgi:small subunit ribosomal protein S7